jgi:hypothetical protein
LLGHADLETTLNVYADTVSDSQKLAVERVAGFFSQIFSALQRRQFRADV